MFSTIVRQLGGLSLLSLGVCLGLAPSVLAAEPLPQASGRQTDGWHDIYLTHNRICRLCRMTDMGNQQVELRNQQHVAGLYGVHEILGVDYHPLQRKVLSHMLKNMNPHARRTLFPHSMGDTKNNHLPYFDGASSASPF